MALPAATLPHEPVHVVFLTRDPVVHQQGGSTTYIVGLLTLLQAQGATLTVVSTLASSRAPRLFFRRQVALPPGVELRVPGYLRLGKTYLRPWPPKVWARLLSRAAVRWKPLRRFAHFVETLYDEGLFAGAWDLTPPTLAECASAIRHIGPLQPTTVVANYCVWGDLLGSGRLGTCSTAILMHDLLSRRTERFQQSGTPLDMPALSVTDERRWLSGADVVLAAQREEAELIAPQVRGQVLVMPVVMTPRALPEEEVVPLRCLFVGSNIPPNQAGLRFLLEAVWPRVRAMVPGATLAIAGSLSQAPELRDPALAQEGVVRLGVVPSLEQEYARAAVCLVPLLFGTGIKIKLLEALSSGKAIVSTSVGIEGLEACITEAVQIADDAEAFVGASVALLTSAPRRRVCQDAALRFAERHFGPGQVIDPAFRQALLSPHASAPAALVPEAALS